MKPNLPGIAGKIVEGATSVFDKIADSLVTDADRRKDDLEQLRNALAGQRRAVISLMARASLARTELERRQAQVTQIRAKLDRAKANGDSDLALATLQTDLSAAEALVQEQQPVLEAAQEAALTGRQALNKAIAAVEQLDKAVNGSESELSQARQVAKQAEDLTASINEHSSQVSRDLAEARAADELSAASGSTTSSSDQSSAKRGRTALETLLKQEPAQEKVFVDEPEGNKTAHPAAK